MPSEHQLALDTLVSAFSHIAEPLDAAGSIAFLRGHPHDGLARLHSKLVFEQPFRPRAARLEAANFKNVERIEGQFDVVLLLPERQRDQTFADFAHAFDLLREGGTLMVCLHNDWGAKRFEKHLQAMAGEINTLSKSHCRVFWTTKTAQCNEATLTEWRTFGGLRRILDGQFWSQPGLFSWDHVDGGSAMLMQYLPENMRGHVADFGSGWGYLSHEVLKKFERVDDIDLFEADRTALEAAKRNLGQLKVPVRPRFHWSDVPNDVPEGRFDFIVMNPPFHEGRAPDTLLGIKFIAAAARALKPAGELWMVANRHLPYEHLLDEAFIEHSIIFQDGSYKILMGKSPKAAMQVEHTRERKGKWPSKMKRNKRRS